MSSADELRRGGGLSAELPGFREREQQIEMAEAVETAIAGGRTLVVEAGTGVGKTLAYLVPALLSGKRTIVSTGTRHLQDQLFGKDLPLVRKALGISVDARLLKGRSNYLCLHRMQLLTGTETRMPVGLQAWSARTVTGDLAEFPGIAEDSPVVPRITSTADNCLGSECPRLRDCFLVKARRAAQQAELVVINHHVLMADLTLKEEGFGELLPNADVLIVDEAHQLADTAMQFLGVNLGSRQLEILARDAGQLERQFAAESQSLRVAGADLGVAIEHLLQALPPTERTNWPEGDLCAEPLSQLRESLGALTQTLTAVADRSAELRACLRRASEFQARLSILLDESSGHVRWFESGQRHFVLRSSPVEVDGLFERQEDAGAHTRIFTSATLAVDGDFSHFRRELGLPRADYLALASPYDYARQAQLYLPTDMPDPQDPGYTRAVVRAVRPLIEASGGAAFLLFTSHRALREAAGQLGDLPFPLLMQGTQPKARLLARFRELGNAVLLGAASFWEGVDVRGPALRLVVIDKLPFASPGDPLLSARLQAMRERGENPFMDHQLPQAVIMLKQGVGRLIRDEHDAGVMVLCDPRLRSRPYGKLFLNSLPAMTRTTDLNVVLEFLHSLTSIHETAGD